MWHGQISNNIDVNTPMLCLCYGALCQSPYNNLTKAECRMSPCGGRIVKFDQGVALLD